MFWHNLKYEVLSGLRVKDVLFWLILFPIVLATFFKIAFGSIYEKTTLFSTIPLAVVETTEQPVLHTVLDNLESGKEPLFAVTYTDEQTALSLLKEQKWMAFFTLGKPCRSVFPKTVWNRPLSNLLRNNIRFKRR